MKIILSVLFCLLSQIVLGDSPLTSTNFCSNYHENRMVLKAAKSDGIITQKQCKYLCNPKVKIDQKMALINALGWNIDGKNNFGILEQFLLSKYKVRSHIDFEYFNGDELLSLGYLMAMDNYFETADALIILEKAVKIKPKSYTYNIIYALVAAQQQLNLDWCNVWKVCQAVSQNKGLDMDMKPEAIATIFDYISSYESSCSSK